MTTFRIVKRAFSEYAEVSTADTWLEASLLAMELQAERRDGEYLVRAAGEPNRLPTQYGQSGFDWL